MDEFATGDVLTEALREFHAVLLTTRCARQTGDPETQKAACAALRRRSAECRLALARLEARVALADHEYL
ncbi:MAG: hypothetical protein WAS23_07430, partial [Dokdonella sp.]